jgi:hypothetical protein
MVRGLSTGIKFAFISLVLCGLIPAAAYGQIEDISMWLEKTRFTPGEEIVVHFTAPASFPPDAWIGLVPTGIPHDFEVVEDQYNVRTDTIQYRYLDGKTAGALIFIAPPRAGIYDFRIYEDESGGIEWGAMPFYVVEPKP